MSFNEPSINVQEWNNSVEYLKQISEYERKYLAASVHDDVNMMVRYLKNIYSLLKRIRLSGRKQSVAMDESSPLGVLRRLYRAEELYMKSLRSDKGSPALKRRNDVFLRDASRECREVFELLGDFQIANNLTFKEGLDVYNSWAEG